MIPGTPDWGNKVICGYTGCTLQTFVKHYASGTFDMDQTQFWEHISKQGHENKISTQQLVNKVFIHADHNFCSPDI